MSRDTLLLVDGHNLLFQMFFGMPARILSRDGAPMPFPLEALAFADGGWKTSDILRAIGLK